jgi:hypothetical protein
MLKSCNLHFISSHFPARVIPGNGLLPAGQGVLAAKIAGGALCPVWPHALQQNMIAAMADKVVAFMTGCFTVRQIKHIYS